MEPLTRGEVLELIALSFAVVSAFAAVMQVPFVRLRRFLLTVLIATLVVDAGVFYKIFYTQEALAKNSPVRKPSPRVSPTPQPSATPVPTPEPSPSVEPEAASVPNAVPFHLSSRDTPSIRSTYCVDGEFGGDYYSTQESLIININQADFDLCKYSDDADRTVIFQVGVVRHNTDSIRPAPVVWSKPVKGRVTAGTPADLAPQTFTFKKSSLPAWKKGKASLSDYRFVIRVINPDKKGDYRLTSDRVSL